MTSLSTWQSKIQTKRKQTPRRQFVKEVASWRPLVFYKDEGRIQKFPSDTTRAGNIVSQKDYAGIDCCEYGRDYQSDQDFFAQWASLYRTVPKSALFHYFNNENCDYADQVHASQNCYLSVGATGGCDAVLYSFFVKESQQVISSCSVNDYSQIVYCSAGIFHSYAIFYSRYIVDSNNIWFCSNCTGCSECLLCDNLTNQSYCIRNVQLDKKSYLTQKQTLLSQKNSFADRYQQLATQGNNTASENCDGNFVVHSQDVQQSMYVYAVNKGRNIVFGGGSGDYEHMYDILTGGGKAHHYGVIFSGGKSEHIYCSKDIGACSYMFYCMYCIGCSFCLGCIGLQNASYCIFNKQYSKEKRYQKIDEIFQQMEVEGTLGDFFPGSTNPFYFNDTAAALIADFDQKDILADGYLWRDEKLSTDIPEWMEVVSVDELGQYERSYQRNGSSPSWGGQDVGSRSINPAILKKVIRDQNGDIYRVIKMEYDFLVKHGLPLPRQHRLPRLKEHMRVR